MLFQYLKSPFPRIILLTDFAAITMCALALASLPHMQCRGVALNMQQSSKKAVLSLATAGSVLASHCSPVSLLRR